MANKNKTLKTMYFISAILMLTIVGFLYSMFGNQQFSIIGGGNVLVGEDGVPYWIIQVDGQFDGGKYIFSAKSQDLDVYVDEQNAEQVVPQDDIEIQIKNTGIYCSYNLFDTEDDVGDSLSRLFGGDNYYFDIGPNTETTALMLVSDSKGNEKEIDALDFGGGKSDVIFKFNDGEIKIQPLGGFVGKYECPTLTTYNVGRNDETGEIRFYEEEDTFWTQNARIDVTERVIGALGMICKSPTASDGVTQAKVVCEVTTDTTLVNPSLRITADAEYLDFKFVPMTSGIPQIVDVIQPDEISEGLQSGINIRIKNIGEDEGYFKIYGESNVLTFATTNQRILLNAGEEDEVSFSVIAPSNVEQDFDVVSTFRVCAISDFGSSNCVTEDFSVKILDAPFILPPPNSCGNNVCDANENYLTCSADCGSPLVCEGLHKITVNNKCICDEGFTMEEDNYGRDYCVEDQSDTMLIVGILAVFLTILIVGIIVYQRRKK